MSQFWIEKRRADAELMLTTGATVRGAFFLATSHPTRQGEERIADLLNAERGFFPFEVSLNGSAETRLVNRPHVVVVKLLEKSTEARRDPGYEVATVRRVAIRLSNGSTLNGIVRVYRPQGRDRLSDYARSPEVFRYVEDGESTLIVNTDHIVEFLEIPA